MVADNVKAAGYADAGFANITTSDGLVHGQVRQAGQFAFVRIYESGHEVPFYQPLAALELFERVVAGKDIETGKIDISAAYRTEGPPTSDFREGNKTVQLDVVGEDDDVVYDVETALPLYENGTSADTGPGANGTASEGARLRRRGVEGQSERVARRKPYRWRPGKPSLGRRANYGVEMPGMRLREMYGL